MALRLLPRIHKASRQVSLHLEGPCRRSGVAPEEGHLLTYLKCYGPCPVNELKRVFGLKNSTLTGILDRLERNEILRRRANPGDRRSFLVGLTRKGERLAVRLNAIVAAFEARVLGSLTERELAGFDAVMEAIATATGVTVRPPTKGAIR